MLKKTMLRAAAMLTLFAILGATLVSLSHSYTHHQIELNEQAALLRMLSALVKPDQYDNELFTDTLTVTDETFLGSHDPMTLYRARKQGKPVAVVLTTVAPDGYNGRILLLVGLDYAGTVLGVRVVSHQETPGLGDGIESRRSDWILGFNRQSLTTLTKEQWKVKRDGGVFDQFSGATITPRAVVKAVYNTLLYYQHYRDQIFASTTQNK